MAEMIKNKLTKKLSMSVAKSFKTYNKSNQKLNNTQTFKLRVE